MKLIADSGSTKTDWCILDTNGLVESFSTAGINPFYQTEIEIRELIETVSSQLNRHPVKEVYFYGAGCSFDDKKQQLAHAIRFFLPSAHIEIQTDMLGICRALLGTKAGIACILGTGSNSCFYDGNKIVENVSPLGFILGDEGSGAVMGKVLVADILKNQLPEELKERFFSETGTTPAEIMEHVYKKPFPNRYLAKFTPFILDNIGEKEIYDRVYEGFRQFFERNVKQYDYKRYEVHFCGSVAYYFREVLSKSALDCGVKPGKIEQAPMSGLVAFHR